MPVLIGTTNGEYTYEGGVTENLSETDRRIGDDGPQLISALEEMYGRSRFGCSIRTMQLLLQEEKRPSTKEPSEIISPGSGDDASEKTPTGENEEAVAPTAADTGSNETAPAPESVVQMGSVSASELQEKKKQQEGEDVPNRVTLVFNLTDKERFETYVTALFTHFRSAITDPENRQIVQSQVVLEALPREFETYTQVAA